jgi:CDP-glucose 4,6-dehydratase
MSRATPCNHPHHPSLFDVAKWAKGMQSVIADIRDLPALHMPWPTPDPRSSSTWPRSRWCAVVPEPGGHLRHQRHGHGAPAGSRSQTPGVKAVVNVTTDKCYENREWVWGYRENEPMGGYDPYSNSKGCAELVSAAYRSSFFNPRPRRTWRGHRHGARRQRHRRRRLGARPADPRHPRAPSKPAPAGPHPQPARHPPLAARAGAPARLPEPGRKLCTSTARTMPKAGTSAPTTKMPNRCGWIVEQMAALWGPGAWQVDAGEHPHEAAYLKLDISKARSRLNWHPR